MTNRRTYRFYTYRRFSAAFLFFCAFWLLLFALNLIVAAIDPRDGVSPIWRMLYPIAAIMQIFIGVRMIRKGWLHTRNWWDINFGRD